MPPWLKPQPTPSPPRSDRFSAAGRFCSHPCATSILEPTGAVSLAGTLAGVLAAGIVAASGALSLPVPFGTIALRLLVFLLIWSGGVFGLFFDSALGATVERKGWLNNDAVNFLSTISAASFTLAVLVWAVSHTDL